ncbi:MAG: hypothetical protein HQK73_10860 [Desulfamplus sp.]|nr:hypothetical protein [Desulfamplus sp.]
MEREIERRKTDRRQDGDRRVRDRRESLNLKNRQQVLDQEIPLAQYGEADIDKILALLLL